MRNDWCLKCEEKRSLGILAKQLCPCWSKDLKNLYVFFLLEQKGSRRICRNLGRVSPILCKKALCLWCKLEQTTLFWSRIIDLLEKLTSAPEFFILHISNLKHSADSTTELSSLTVLFWVTGFPFRLHQRNCKIFVASWQWRDDLPCPTWSSCPTASALS